MAKPCSNSDPAVSRRDFLTLASAGATLAMAGGSEQLLGARARPSAIGRWEAGKPARSEGIVLTREQGSDWRIEDQDGKYVARIQPGEDYYTQAAFRARIRKPVDSPFWLVLEYLDYGFGLISIDVSTQPSHPIRWSHQWGVARLNTGRLRRAVFYIESPSFHLASGSANGEKPNLHIRGLECLHSVSMAKAKPEIETVPSVEPVVKLDRRFQCDINIRVDSPLGEEAEGVAAVRNLAPLVRALGFNAVESYVQWNYVERQPGVFDWSHYDGIVDELKKYDLKLFPLLIVGSAYALPEWYYKEKGNAGFKCLEHHVSNAIPSIFAHLQDAYVQRFIKEFAKHYGTGDALLGLRLGPSGNYGEAQYPATGNLGYNHEHIHTHAGWWAADSYASPAFQEWLKSKYPTIDALNQAWNEHFTSFGEIQTFLPPCNSFSDRVTFLPSNVPLIKKQLDFTTWYMGAMSDWCGQWAKWTRAELPDASIFMSSGGWGPTEIGTDYTAQSKTMAELRAGIRLTNESDNYPLNFAITRMASSAARFYGAKLGYEPGGFSCMRGVVARIFNVTTNGGEHLFFYYGNLFGNDQGAEAWQRYAPLINQRAKPVIDVAAFYPDTEIALNDEIILNLYASAYLNRAQEMRSITDFDYASEQMILDGALDRYKALVFLWGYITLKPVLERLDAWVRAGGTIICSERPRGVPRTIEDQSIAEAWLRGDTGKGRVYLYKGDAEPPRYYIEYIRRRLLMVEGLRPEIRKAIGMRKSRDVYWSILEGGKLALLNFSDAEARFMLPKGSKVVMDPYSMMITDSWI